MREMTYRSSASVVASTAPAPVSPVVAPVPIVPGIVSQLMLCVCKRLVCEC